MTNIERINEIEKLLIKGNNNIKTKEVKVYGYQYNYYATLFGTINDYYFKEHEVFEYIAPLNSESLNNNRPGTLKEKTLSICIHDTASSAPTADSLAHAKYVYNGGGGTSWHYSVGDTGIYHQIPDNEVAYHAGDGLVQDIEFYDTCVKATVSDPIIEIIDGYYYINGEKSSLTAPTTDNEELCNTNDINDAGIRIFIGDNNNYFMYPTYYNKTYKKIANRLGNKASIGIETMVNQGSNLLVTWHKCAKLVAHLLIDNNLFPSDVYPHHAFSGKPCPKTLRDNHLWNKFLDFVNIEYNILKLKTNDTSIELISNIDNFDGVLNSEEKEDIKYQVKITVGNESKVIDLVSSIVK